MRPLYCSENPPCSRQCRACKETEAINHAYVQRQIEERERQHDEANPPDDVIDDINIREQP